jgi:hypothetical protein
VVHISRWPGFGVHIFPSNWSSPALFINFSSLETNREEYRKGGYPGIKIKVINIEELIGAKFLALDEVFLKPFRWLNITTN